MSTALSQQTKTHYQSVLALSAQLTCPDRPSSGTSIMLAKTPQTLFHLLLVVAMYFLKGSGRLAHILSIAPGSGGLVQEVGVVTCHVLLDCIPLCCVAAGECVCLLDDSAGITVVVAVVTAMFSSSFATNPTYQHFQILWLFFDNLRF